MAVTKRKSVKTTVDDSSLEGKYMDIFVRMEEDSEKDYCFSVPSDKPVSWLYNIFEVITLNLSPSYFYHDKPDRFCTSIHPGYLTGEGCVLFTDDAHADIWQKDLPSDAKIGDVITEGQLVVPHWKPNNKRWLRVVLFLAFWLYLDLPEFISPTPGTAPTKLLFWLVEEYMPAPPSSKTDYFNQPVWQCLFFLFHLVKVLLFYLVLWNGSWHPKTLNLLNPSRYREKDVIPSAQGLNSIGWTGTRRWTTAKWHQTYLDYRTEVAGGVVEAYKKGILTRKPGVYLKEGEGWNVLKSKRLSDVTVDGNTFLDSEGRFVISQRYFMEVTKKLTELVNSSKISENEKILTLRSFREYGWLDGTETLRGLFDDYVSLNTPNSQN